MTDWELLQHYVHDGSRQALDELVRRHMAMVHATALRETRDPHSADDVTQAVFLVLIRRAGQITPRVVLGGWLFKVALYAAADARKSNKRREHHEREAAEMNPPSSDPETARVNETLLPLLNHAIASLPSADRDAVVMAYLQGRSHRDVAEALNITENTARQRLFRSLAKLRAQFQQQGVALSETTLGTALIGASIHPAHLAGRIVPAILSTSPGDSILAHAALAEKMMVIAKIKFVTLIAVCVAFLALAGGGLTYHLLVQTDFAQQQAAAQPAPAPMPATQPASPLDVVRDAWHGALAGDVDAVVSRMDSPAGSELTMVQQGVRASKAVTLLQKAIDAKFGAGQVEQIYQAVGLDESDADLALSKITYFGDRALVALGNSDCKVPFTKVDGQWKIDPAVLDQLDWSGVRKLDDHREQLQQLAQDVTTGKYNSVNQVVQEVLLIVLTPASQPAGPAI